MIKQKNDWKNTQTCANCLCLNMTHRLGHLQTTRKSRAEKSVTPHHPARGAVPARFHADQQCKCNATASTEHYLPDLSQPIRDVCKSLFPQPVVFVISVKHDKWIVVPGLGAGAKTGVVIVWIIGNVPPIILPTVNYRPA